MAIRTKINSTSVTILILALIALLVVNIFSFSAQVVNAAEARTIIVPNDYPTISAAIGNASQGDTVLVKKGLYQENPIIDKSISVVSEEIGGALVLGAGGEDRGTKAIFLITADNVVLSGFTIRSKNYSSTNRYATGIRINSNNVTINSNDINGTYYCIFSSFLSSSKITNNNLTFAIKEGIRICGGSQNTISNNRIDKSATSGLAIEGYSDIITYNTLNKNGRGIGLGAAYSTVVGNNISGSLGMGLYIGGSGNTISYNTITKSVWSGIYLTMDFATPNNNTIYLNNFINNSVSVNSASIYNGQIWDNGSEGNYWSNYNGTDANGDGIGETPYSLYEGNTDRFPLMQPKVPPQNLTPSLPFTPSPINGTVSKWYFDEIKPNGVTPDTLENNPMVVETADGVIISPILVEGKFGNALRFNGSDYAYVSASPTLDITGEFTVDAWVNVQQYKAVEYNIIIVESLRTQDSYPTRTFGFAINGVAPDNNSLPAIGALRGFFLDDKGVFNEIVTTQATVPLNEWTHVTFVRSFSSGMHIYINGIEESIQAISGVQNPSGSVGKGSEYYVGHDSMSTLENLSISTKVIVEPTAQPTLPPVEPIHVWAEWLFWTAILAAILVFLASTFLLIKRNSKKI